MTTKEIATKILELLSPIPEEQWITGGYTNHSSGCCAKGHLCRLLSDDPSDYSRRNCASQLHNELCSIPLSMVNDGGDWGYQQATPKARVIAYLNDIINQ